MKINDLQCNSNWNAVRSAKVLCSLIRAINVRRWFRPVSSHESVIIRELVFLFFFWLKTVGTINLYLIFYWNERRSVKFSWKSILEWCFVGDFRYICTTKLLLDYTWSSAYKTREDHEIQLHRKVLVKSSFQRNSRKKSTIKCYLCCTLYALCRSYRVIHDLCMFW